MTILEKILSHKREEVRNNKELYPPKLLEKSLYFPTPCVSLVKYLARTDLVGIIAEIKRKSPSKGVINQHIAVDELSIGYMQAGASALSILTDTHFFGGTSADLTLARKNNFCPILRKDFIIDEYQVLEAKSIGADVILLIAAALTPKEVQDLSKFAKSLGLEVLLEVHSEDELSKNLLPSVDLIGVNNRNLADFSLDLSLSEKLAPKIPPSYTKISESGIDSAAAILNLKRCGYRGFLIGEAFMRTGSPARACGELVSSVLNCSVR